MDRSGGHRFLEMEYLKWPGVADSSAVHGRIISRRSRSTARPSAGLFGEAETGAGPRLRRGKSLALVVWPGKHPSGKPIVNETYLPETVESVDGLKDRAALYGCQVRTRMPV